MDVGAGWMLCPAFPTCILMSLSSRQGHCTVEQLQLQFHLPDAQKPRTSGQSKTDYLFFSVSLQKTPTMGDKSDLLTQCH